MPLDRYDRMILEALQRDGRISNVHLAQEVNLSESATLRRVRALEEAGMIDRYAALLSQNAVGLPGNVFVQIGLHREVESDLAAFEAAVRNIPEVMECYLMSGEFDYLLRVVVADDSVLLRDGVEAMDQAGFGNCSNHYACAEACPKEIPVRYIARLNREFMIAALTSREFATSRSTLADDTMSHCRNRAKRVSSTGRNILGTGSR